MRLCLIAHMGVADHLNQVGLVRDFAETCTSKDTIVYLDKGNCTDMLRLLFSEEPSVELCTDPLFGTTASLDDAWIKQKTGCDTIVRLGIQASQGKFGGETRKSFMDCIYEQASLEPMARIANFRIPSCVHAMAKVVYDRTCQEYGTDYCVIHEDPSLLCEPTDAALTNERGVAKTLNRSYLSNPDLPILQLNRCSDTMLDYLDVCANAKEIHLIDSSWATLLYLCAFQDQRFQNVPVFLHLYARSVQNEYLYEPRHPNWTYLT